MGHINIRKMKVFYNFFLGNVDMLSRNADFPLLFNRGTQVLERQELLGVGGGEIVILPRGLLYSRSRIIDLTIFIYSALSVLQIILWIESKCVSKVCFCFSSVLDIFYLGHTLNNKIKII